jgi:hypothetical protein
LYGCLVSHGTITDMDIHDHQVADLDDQEGEYARPLECNSRNGPAFRVHMVLVPDQDDAPDNPDYAYQRRTETRAYSPREKSVINTHGKMTFPRRCRTMAKAAIRVGI